MNHRVIIAIAASVAAGSGLGPGVATAESTNAMPIIAVSDVPVDVASIPWLTDAARTYVGELDARFQKAEVSAYVVAAAPNGVWGVRSNVAGGYVDPSIADMARQALEQCEFWYLLPCYIVAINGMAARDALGGYADQPQMLDPEPSRFDYARVPFAPEVDRRSLRDYQNAPAPKALAMSDNGWWTYKSGKTAAEAITQALAACKAGNGEQDCMLYALNNIVVLDFSR